VHYKVVRVTSKNLLLNSFVFNYLLLVKLKAYNKEKISFGIKVLTQIVQFNNL
jgi:hypothetical protein